MHYINQHYDTGTIRVKGENSGIIAFAAGLMPDSVICCTKCVAACPCLYAHTFRERSFRNNMVDTKPLSFYTYSGDRTGYQELAVACNTVVPLWGVEDMSHIFERLRSCLEFPFIYESFQNLTGLDNCRKRFVKEFVRPFPGASVLDIGCGSGKIIEHFPESIREYVGYDYNRRYIEYAREKYAGRGRFFTAGVSAPPPLSDTSFNEQFDFVIAFGILHHINDSDADTLFMTASHYLKKSGTLVTLDPVYIDGQSLLTKYIISRDRGQFVRTVQGYVALLNARFIRYETTVLNDTIRVPTTHLIIRAAKH